MKIWILGDNRVGNTNQAIALASQLNGEYKLINIEYNIFGKLPNFLLQYYPVHVSNKLLQSLILRPAPDLIITASRRLAPLALYLKKKFKHPVKLIQIMRPCLAYNKFDLVVLPYHDKVNEWGAGSILSHYCEATKVLLRGSKNCVKTTSLRVKIENFSEAILKIIQDCRLSYLGNLLAMTNCVAKSEPKNIVRINGGLNNVSSRLPAAEIVFKKHYPHLKKFIAVIIGGSNKNYNFGKQDARRFSELLAKIHKNHQVSLFISFSRRTSAAAKLVIKSNLSDLAIIYDPTENEVFNPYLGMLATAEYIIVTADSISMCTEAVSSGISTYIYIPANFNSIKHKIFVKQLVAQKIARILDESVIALEQYEYTPLNEIGKVVKAIRSLA